MGGVFNFSTQFISTSVASLYPVPWIPGQIDEGKGYGRRDRLKDELVQTVVANKLQGDWWANKMQELAKNPPKYNLYRNNCSDLDDLDSLELRFQMENMRSWFN